MEFIFGMIVGFVLRMIFFPSAAVQHTRVEDRKEPTVEKTNSDGPSPMTMIATGVAVGYGAAKLGKKLGKTSYSKAGNSIKPKYPSRIDKNKPRW